MTVANEVRLYYAACAFCCVTGCPVVLLALAADNWWLVSHVIVAQFVAMVVQLFTGGVADRMGIRL